MLQLNYYIEFLQLINVILSLVSTTQIIRLELWACNKASYTKWL